MAANLPAKEQVFHRAQIRGQREILVHGLDTRALSVGSRVERDGLAVDEDLPGIRLSRPGQDPDKSALACTVVTDQRHHLAGIGPEANPAQCPNMAVGLGDLARLQDRTRKVIGLAHGCVSLDTTDTARSAERLVV